jgi:glycosyltransferase involved in cell wall biosynthesis
MKILVLNYEFPPVGGGGGRITEDICRGLAKRGHPIRVQTAYIKGLQKHQKKDGFEVYRSFSFRQRPESCSVLEMIAFIVLNIIPTLKHIRQWQPDIIHAHFALPTGMLALIIHWITQIPYLLTVHLGDIPGGNPDLTDHYFNIVRPLTYPIWEQARLVTAVSEYSKQVAIKSYDVPIHVIPNGIDLDAVQISASCPNQTVRLVFAGRFDTVKNLPFFVGVLESIKDLDWVMTFLGDGPDMGVVKREIEAAGLSAKCQLPGWVDENTVSEVMQRADIFVLPSRYEGLSMAGLKAMAHGLAILGSDVPGIANVVQHGVNGYLCPIGDLDAFENTLRIMLLDSAQLESMKIESRRLVKRYDLEDIITDYERSLEEAAR